MVLEYGDIDLARLLQNHEEARRRQLGTGGPAGGSGGSSASVAGGSGEIDENFIRLYWQQMLQVSLMHSLLLFVVVKLDCTLALLCPFLTNSYALSQHKFLYCLMLEHSQQLHALGCDVVSMINLYYWLHFRLLAASMSFG